MTDPSRPAQCEKVLRLLQASSCFDDVCASLPCACAESLADGVREKLEYINGTFGPLGHLTGDIYRLLEEAKAAGDSRALDILRYAHEVICRARHEIMGSEIRALPPRPVFPTIDDQDPPMKWLIESLRGLARDLLADPKTTWIGERDPKRHICWTAADRLAALSQGSISDQGDSDAYERGFPDGRGGK